MEKEFTLQNIEFKTQQEVVVFYKGEKLEKNYKPDFIVSGKVIVEIKALERLTGVEKSQLFELFKGNKYEDWPLNKLWL